MHRDLDAEFVRKGLQLAFPELHTRAVAATAVRGDRQAFGLWIADAADLLPPSADRVDRESRGVMVHPNTDPASVRGHVVDPVRDRAAQLLDQEVMYPDLLWVTLWTPFPTIVLEACPWA